MKLPRIDRYTCCNGGKSRNKYGETSDRGTERRYPEIEEAVKLFKVLADETRLGILRQLRDQGEVCACDFLACCAVAQPTVSHHLKVLREAGLVKAVKRGLWVHYSLNREKLAMVNGMLP